MLIGLLFSMVSLFTVAGAFALQNLYQIARGTAEKEGNLTRRDGVRGYGPVAL